MSCKKQVENLEFGDEIEVKIEFPIIKWAAARFISFNGKDIWYKEDRYNRPHVTGREKIRVPLRSSLNDD